jgi:tripartite-type tricarboxylate transporter receptor subunit TctC
MWSHSPPLKILAAEAAKKSIKIIKSLKTMNTDKRTLLKKMAAYASLGVMSSAALADDHNKRSLALIISQPPGGGMDAVARLLGTLLGEVGNVNVVTENLSGGSGIIAANRLMNGPRPDTTLMLALPSLFTTVPLLSPELLKFNPDQEFKLVATVGVQKYLLVALSDVDLRAYLQRRGSTATSAAPIRFGLSNPSGITHFAALAMQQMARWEFDLIPYRGMSDVGRALLSEQVQFAVVDEVTAQKLRESGKVQIVAALSPEPCVLFPEAPLFREFGLGELNMDNWLGLFASKHMADSQSAQLASNFEALNRLPAFHQGMRRLGLMPMLRTGRDAQNYSRLEIDRFRKLILKYKPNLK